MFDDGKNQSRKISCDYPFKGMLMKQTNKFRKFHTSLSLHLKIELVPSLADFL
jgi:hypothetical protein